MKRDEDLIQKVKATYEVDNVFLSNSGDIHDLADDVAKFYDQQTEKGRSTQEIEMQAQLLLHFNRNYF